MPTTLGVTSSEDSGLLAPEVIDTRTVPPHRSFELLHDAYWPDSLAVVPTPSVGTSLDLKMIRWKLENAVFADTDSFDHLGKVLEDKPDDAIFMARYIRGSIRIWFDGRDYLARKGDIFFAMSASGMVFETKDLVSFVAMFPLDLLGIDRSLVSTPKLIPAGSLENRLLSSAMEIWQNELRSLQRADASVLEAGMLGLVRSVLEYGADAARQNAEAEAARGHAIRRFLEAELARPDLGVDLISRTFDISRATIYRTFEDDGGVAGFVTRRRLHIALHALAGGPPHRGRIQEVARSVGFTDPFHFSKAFRKHFGFSPSDVLPLAEIAGSGD